MRLVEVRLLDGPNIYRLEPAVKVEVAIGRRRTWYGQRVPERHSIVRLGARVTRAAAPAPLARLADWVRRLHTIALHEARRDVAVHRTGEPGHWVVSFGWRERGCAEALANAAYRLTERGLDPRRDAPPAHVLRRIVEADTTPPEWISDEERRVPLISVSGTNGKSTTTRMIAHILQLAARRVGMTTTEGVYIGGELVEEGDLTGPYGAHAVLGRDDVDVAVLETARGGIVLRGLGYESNDAAVLTNVSADHLDLQGVHTLPEMAEVKSVIAQVTRPNGAVVLNAEDPFIAAVARRVRAPVTFFSLRPGHQRVRRHTARGGRAMVLDDGWLVEVAGERRRRIVRAAEIPATIGGLARHNVANALAAAAGARAMGATIEHVAAGLRDFRPTADQMPGRLNLYRLGRRLVVVDYAHNEAGLEALFDLGEALVGRRERRRPSRATVSAIIGAAGDRPDDVLRSIGRIAGSRADEVAIRIGRRYLRGRTTKGLTGTLLAGVREAGMAPATVPIYEDEPESLHAELTTPGRLAADDGEPRLVLLMCHTKRDEVRAVLESLGAVPVEDPATLAEELRGVPLRPAEA